jgi:hypothetical protein
MADRKPERITPEALGELIRRSAVCVCDQEGRCPLVLFTQVMASRRRMNGDGRREIA